MAIPNETVTFNVKPKRPHVTAIWILAAVLFLSLIGHYLTFRWNESRESDLLVKNAALRNTIAINDFILKREQAHSDSLMLQIAKSTARNKKVLEVKERAISTLSKKLAILRVPVQAILDTSAILSEFVDTYDSMNQEKDSLISEMKLRHAAEVVDLNALINSQAKQIMAAVTTGEAWRTAAENAQKAETKATKAKKFWRGAAMVATAGVAVLLLSPK